MEENCIFCKIVKGEIPGERVFENDNFIVIKDANPKVERHLLVVSKKHFKSILDTPSTLYGEFLEIAKEVAFDMLKGRKGEQNKPEGFNFVFNVLEAGGQVVPHVHLHILPRREGDGFKLNV